MGPDIGFERRDVEIAQLNRIATAAIYPPACERFKIGEFLLELWVDRRGRYISAGRDIDVVQSERCAAWKRDPATKMPGVAGAAETFLLEKRQRKLRHGSDAMISSLAADFDMPISKL